MIILTKEEFYTPGLYTLVDVEWRNNMYLAGTKVTNLCENVLYIACNDVVRRKIDSNFLFFAVYRDDKFHLFEIKYYTTEKETRLSELIPEIGPYAALEFMEL
jgi:hypothetical protein